MNIDTNWEWDSESRGPFICTERSSDSYSLIFIVTKYVLEIIKPIAVKLQKKDENIVHADTQCHQ